MNQPLSKISTLALTVTATAVIAADTFVGFNFQTAAAGAAALGVAKADAKAGENVGVDIQGAIDMRAGAAIAAGAEVQVGANGLPITKAAGLAVGRALTAAANPGDIVTILLK